MNIYYSIACLHHEIDQELKLNGFMNQKPRNQTSWFQHGNVTYLNLLAGPIAPSLPQTG